MQDAIEDQDAMICQFGGDQRRAIALDSATRLALNDGEWGGRRIAAASRAACITPRS